jgi:uncharacterized membrane protein
MSTPNHEPNVAVKGGENNGAWIALHVLGVVLFLGNLIVTALWKTLADQTRDPRVIAYAQRLVTITDVAFTATGAALITVTGFVLASDWGGITGPSWLTTGSASSPRRG